MPKFWLESGVPGAMLAVAIHLACCGALFLWLQRRVSPRSMQEKIALVLVTVMFAAHPISTFAMLSPQSRHELTVALCVFCAALVWQSALYGRRYLGWGALAIASYVAWANGIVAGGISDRTTVATGLEVVAAIGHSLLAIIWPWSSTGVRGFEYTTCGDGVVFDLSALIAGGGLIVGTIALTIAALVRRRRYRPWLMDAAWFVLPLMLVIVGSHDRSFAVEEHRLYVPCFGICALVARAVLPAVRAGILARTSVLLVTGVVAIALATSSVAYLMRRQSRYDFSLFQYQREAKNPVFARQLSQELIRRKQRSRAFAILRRGYHDAEQRCDNAARTELGLLAMAQLVYLTPDLNQAQLMGLRAAYDRMLAEGSLYLQTPELTLQIPAGDTQKLVIQDEARLITLPRALAWTRTMELGAAEQQLLRLTQRDKTNQDAWALLAIVYARQAKWTHLQSVLGIVAQLPVQDVALQDVVHRVKRARALARTPVRGEVSTAIRDAQVQLILNAPEAARRLLDPSFQWTPTHRELVLTYAQTYIDDRRRDLAEQLIQRTRELDPRHADFWTQALSRVRTQPAS